MIYRSNLTAPDLTPYFKHLHVRPMPHSMGHSVPSDWADKSVDDPVFGVYKNCGFWTHDEAAILHNVAKSLPSGDWLDIGCHTGWTTLHIALAHDQLGSAPNNQIGTCNYVHYIDPMLAVPEFHQRFRDNLPAHSDGKRYWTPGCETPYTSRYFFDNYADHINPCIGIVIDGDHEPGQPLEDAVNAEKHLAPEGVILFHDFVGLPVREAVRWLIQEKGFQCRIYLTPHVVAACWRADMIGPLGDFHPPIHIPDPGIVAQDLPARWPEWDWSKCL